MSSQTFIGDAEVLELLADDPELLALADVISAIRPPAVAMHAEQRPHRRHELFRKLLDPRGLAAAAFAIVVLGGSTSLALGQNPLELFEGSPPNPTSQRHFAVGNDEFGRLSAAWGVVDPASVHGVLSAATDDGTLDLWAASARDGGISWFLQIVGDSDPSTNIYGPSGWFARNPHLPAIWWMDSPNDNLPGLRYLLGHTWGDAVSVQIDFADGTSRTIPVIEGFFLTTTPIDARPMRLTTHDANGASTATSTNGDFVPG